MMINLKSLWSTMCDVVEDFDIKLIVSKSFLQGDPKNGPLLLLDHSVFFVPAPTGVLVYSWPFILPCPVKIRAIGK